jgi:hypothetical protein
VARRELPGLGAGLLALRELLRDELLQSMLQLRLLLPPDCAAALGCERIRERVKWLRLMGRKICIAI